MGSFASCKFPFLDEWKKFAGGNPAAGWVDAVLSGFAQIIFSDNSFSGLLLCRTSFSLTLI